MEKLNTSTAWFRFYEELNDFLPPEHYKIRFAYSFTGHPAIKDVVEALGVPHAEIDLILINGKSVNWQYQLQPRDEVSVYPTFESFDITDVTHLRAAPLRQPKFILDVHLGKLARYLRLLGLDAWYENHYQDIEIIRLAKRQQRIILTRDVGLLKNKQVTHGYWLRSKQPEQQLIAVVKRFDLRRVFKPFTRCLICNGRITAVDKHRVDEQLPEQTRYYYQTFYQCKQCRKIYWQGAHYERLQRLVEKILSNHLSNQ
jgi:uncharacterized protein with PIN domain